MLVEMAGSENIERAGQIGFEAKMQNKKAKMEENKNLEKQDFERPVKEKDSHDLEISKLKKYLIVVEARRTALSAGGTTRAGPCCQSDRYAARDGQDKSDLSH